MGKTISGRPEADGAAQAAPDSPDATSFPARQARCLSPGAGEDAGKTGLGGVVLFVDDEPQVLETFRRVFHQESFAVATASSAALALDILARGAAGRGVDVVVTDEKMPGMSGSELLAETARRHPSVIGVMLTGEASLDAAIRGINQGRVFRFLTKPFATDRLAAIIREALAEKLSREKMSDMAHRVGGIASLEWNLADGLVRWSRDAGDLFPLAGGAMPPCIEDLAELVVAEDRALFSAGVNACLLDGRCGMVRFRTRRPDGGVRWVAQTLDVIRDDAGKTVRVLAVYRDVTEEVRREKALRHQATHDALTGLFNRTFVLKELRRRLERAIQDPGAAFSTIFFDLDDFKYVNDSLGHAVGDRLLVAVAAVLAGCLGDGDVLGRFGGDEFVALLDDGDQGRRAPEVVDRVNATLRRGVRVDNHTLFLQASAGIVAGTTGGRGCVRLPEDILRDADTAMYRAKAGGKGGYVLFDASMRREADRRLQLATHLRQAIPRGEVRLVYQPLVHPATGGLAGFEALARWRHPRLGVISPGEFIPVAEQTNLIGEIGRFALAGAAATLRGWLDRFPRKPFFVSVNVSGCQFRHADLAAEVEQALRRERLPAGALKLEITESVLMEHPDAAAETLARLKGLGAAVFIDDFGTGYSSLAVLRRLPAEAIKIDQSFVRGLDEERGWELVRLMVAMAHALNMDVVVEGVERKDEAAGLLDMGCDMIQGHYFGAAMEEEAAGELLGGEGKT